MDWQGSFRGRAGFAVSKALIYGTGGIAFGNISHTYTNLITGISETASNTRTGWTAGGGVEVALTPNILALSIATPISGLIATLRSRRFPA